MNDEHEDVLAAAQLILNDMANAAGRLARDCDRLVGLCHAVRTDGDEGSPERDEKLVDEEFRRIMRRFSEEES
jgi:hypothetical protein